MNYNKIIFTIIMLINLLFCGFTYDSMNINYIPASVSSSAMGGVYNPNYNSEKIMFSHLSRFGGIYTLEAIQYNNILFVIHGVENIANTTEAWIDIDEDGPNANEIDYSKIDYFNIKDYNLVLTNQIHNKYNISIKGTLSSNYNHHGFGLGLNIVTTKKKTKYFDYYLGIYDIVSFKKWTTSSLEYYYPKMMISVESKILNSLNILTLYGTYNDNNDNQNYIIDYRLGSKFNITDNVNLFFGKSKFNKLSIGFSVSNNLFNIDYCYVISSSNLPFNDSYNIGLGLNINSLIEKSKKFSPLIFY